MYTMKLVLALCLLLLGVCYGTSSDSNGTQSEIIDDSELLRLGRKLHKPMLTLIGMAIRKLHPCQEWSQWTPCDVDRRGQFGSQTRTRTCSKSDVTVNDVTSENMEKREEMDYRLCEGVVFCPLDYNLTRNGFCLKLNITKVPNNEADKQCQKEGGYLINIDSQQKYDEVKIVLTGFSSNIHIDGVRSSSSAPWTYKYGSQTSILSWLSGWPKNQTDYLCLVLKITNLQRYDFRCSYERPFICEVPKS